MCCSTATAAGGLAAGKVPPTPFYDLNGLHNRVYFYRLDDRGYLYLEQTLHDVEKKQRGLGRTGTSGRNITVALKDPKFLNFFFSMLKPSPLFQTTRSEASVGFGFAGACVAGIDVAAYCAAYPLVSLCGKERNFLLPDDPLASLGFTDLSADGTALLYAAGLAEPFSPDLLLYGRETGRLYHAVSTHKRLKGRLGVLHPHLAQRVIADLSEAGDSLTFSWAGRKHILRTF